MSDVDLLSVVVKTFQGHVGRKGQRGGSEPREGGGAAGGEQDEYEYGGAIHSRKEEAQARQLKEHADELRKFLKESGIPAGKMAASGMVRGYSSVSAQGVRVEVGHSWEKEGYNKGQARQAAKKGFKSRWREPSVIKVEILAHDSLSKESEGQTARAKDWTTKIKKWAESKGLKIDKQSEFGNDLVIKLSEA